MGGQRPPLRMRACYIVDLSVKVEQKVSALRTALSDSTVILFALQLLPAL